MPRHFFLFFLLFVFFQLCQLKKMVFDSCSFVRLSTQGRNSALFPICFCNCSIQSNCFNFQLGWKHSYRCYLMSRLIPLFQWWRLFFQRSLVWFWRCVRGMHRLSVRDTQMLVSSVTELAELLVWDLMPGWAEFFSPKTYAWINGAQWNIIGPQWLQRKRSVTANFFSTLSCRSEWVYVDRKCWMSVYPHLGRYGKALVFSWSDCRLIHCVSKRKKKGLLLAHSSTSSSPLTPPKHPSLKSSVRPWTHFTIFNLSRIHTWPVC